MAQHPHIGRTQPEDLQGPGHRRARTDRGAASERSVLLSTRELHLGLNAPGIGTYKSAWRRTGIDPESTATGEFYIRLAQLAEQGLFDAFFLADQPALDGGWDRNASAARLDPVIALTTAAAHTEYVGLVATVSSTWHHPYNLARSIQSLDRVSHGRAGWNVVTSYNPRIAGSYGLDSPPPKAERYARAREFTGIVESLWRTWSPGAIVADKESGVFARADAVNPITHTGEFFSVDGGSTVPPSEQGLPVIFQAGGSAAGLDLASRYADAVFASAMTLEVALDLRRRLDTAASVRASSRAPVLILPGAALTLASTDEEAARRREELDGIDGSLSGRQYLAGRLGLSPDELDLDAPLPLHKVDLEERKEVNSEGFLRSIVGLAESGRPLRELLRDGTGHLTVVGSPGTVADTFETWFATSAVDGFNLMFDVIEESLPLFVDEVVPLLQDRGLFRRKYEGTTLRDHLGLPRPRW
ncbi:NtaA/DmoA family FMN-dependent monooxygenase [Mycolicibacterium septicum]|uniref:NtaA/DmoA family FMN-dependent monooxygenase n=1 Tax=Mycolicibacterium septicum TaxID=98668 RepID=UPI0023E18542|nr:NtaA/DmoA family FMN-dependent monooxygenase [Mycolicibacterium septicum]MDF3336386.1 NtaA/DmoA family FMN-dependent monooxygenase [Mycolicibacterium septicum]